MRFFKITFLAFFIIFAISTVGVNAYLYAFGGVAVPAFSGRYTSDKYVTKTDDSVQTILTTYTNHAVKARVAFCEGTSSIHECVAEGDVWVKAPTDSEKELTDSACAGGYRLQLMTVGYQLTKTNYSGYWYYQK